ncbi:hypothetical protein [Streptomyces sp. NPDC087294]|uniref:hypothetical protein n=1 Tax=Streptomyces sp. NPDC087294 TaxID=3365777 RepID=UPI00380242AF
MSPVFNGITQAAVTINTSGLSDLLLKNALPLGVSFIGTLIVIGGRRRDASGSVTMTGITLLGLGVVGMAAFSTDIGQALIGMVIRKG